MKKNNNENLSALVDGEHCGDKNLLKDLIKSDNMKSTWKRYHLIRDCLRGNLTDNIYNDFSKNIKNLLQNDPAIFLPKGTKQFKYEPIIGFAIAASVAVVAILGIQNKSNISPYMETNTVVMDEKIIDSQQETFSFHDYQMSPRTIKASAKPSTKFDSFTKQRLNNYLINHSKYRHNIKMNSVLPYARIVTIDSEE